jgi:hypothetical protein
VRLSPLNGDRLVCRRSEITIYACSIAYVITPAYGMEWSSTTMNKFALTVVEAAEAASIRKVTRPWEAGNVRAQSAARMAIVGQ